MTDSRFHTDEIAIQQQLGVAEPVARISQQVIRGFMPQQHRDFFANLPFIVISLVDRQGVPWAMPLFGEVGFISSPDKQHLHFNLALDWVDPLGLRFEQGQKVGILGIQLQTRRRNRMNGVLAEITDQGFLVKVEQSFGNCPKYIQTRELQWQADNDKLKPALSGSIEMHETLPAAGVDLIAKADTFFIGSRSQTLDNSDVHGLDISHRGGKPGFIKWNGKSILFPDYSGNRFFNTLGNIRSDSRVGLLFMDFATGDILLSSGHANIRWQHEALTALQGAERILEIELDKSVYLKETLPFTAKLLEASPFLENTSVW